MELDLREIASTVLVGAFVLLLIEALFWYVFSIELSGFFRGRLGWDRATWLPFSVFLALSVPAGIAAEDFALQVVSDRPEVLSMPAEALIEGLALGHVQTRRSSLQRKWDLRFQPLLGGDLGAALRASKPGSAITVRARCASDFAGSANGEAVCARPLLRDLATSKAMSPLCGNAFVASETAIASESDWTLGAKGYECLQRVYYHARNRVALLPTYNEELRRIDIRRRIAASFALFSSFGAFLILACALAALLWNSAAALSDAPPEERQAWRPPSYEPGAFRKLVDAPWVRRTFIAIACLCMLTLAWLIAPSTPLQWTFAAALAASALAASAAMFSPRWAPLSAAVLVAVTVVLALRLLHIGFEFVGLGMRVFESQQIFHHLAQGWNAAAWTPTARLLVSGPGHLPIYLVVGATASALVYYACSRKIEHARNADDAYWPSMLISVPTLTTLLVALLASSVWIYEFELDEYNKRVFGMYLDLHVVDVRKVGPAGG